MSRMLFHGQDGDKDGNKEDDDQDRDFRNLCITILLERVFLSLESKWIRIRSDCVFTYTCRRTTSPGSTRSKSFSDLYETL